MADKVFGTDGDKVVFESREYFRSRNPIRIAQGPPTEEGDYKCRAIVETGWMVCEIRKLPQHHMVVSLVDGESFILSDLIQEGWQFSTRIPDPEEMG